MDIYLLRQGEQIGPLSEGDVQTLLKSGETTLDDFAWRDGLPTWQPLHAVLYPKSATQKILPPPPADAPTPTPEPFRSPASEPASPRQKAFLTYLGITFSGDITKERAAVLLNDAAEDPKHAARIKRWDEERLRLHPDLFADEIRERKERRADHFLHLCETEGAEFFRGVTKAHAQVLVGYLDVQHPHWDEHAEATRYFFAALAEKFPPLVKPGAKGQLKFPDGPKAAASMERSGLVVRPRRKRSPLAAALRGIGIGLLVLAALYGAATFYERHIAGGPPAPQVPQADMPLPTPPAAPVASTEMRDEPAVPGLPRDEPGAPAASTPAPATPEPAPIAMPAATPPAPEAPPAIPATAAPTAALPEAPPAIPMAATPAPIPLLLDPAPATPAPATPAPRTAVTITKATPVTLRFGSSTLSAGMIVPIVKVNGESVLVQFGPDVIAVPIAHTDLASAPPK